MLIFLVTSALSSFAGALLLGGLHPQPSAAHVHLALAAGALPLIFAAMLHFVPVLTRSGAPLPALRWLPLPVLAGGALLTLAFLFPPFLAAGRHIATFLTLLAAVVLLLWMGLRGRQALGKPHPGLHWYAAALACLILALLTVFAMSVWPQHYLAWKRLHLHLNTLGLIGMTAVGTVQVLLPTAVGRPDAQSAGRLRSDWPLALIGTLLAASGAASGLSGLSWGGLALWLFPLGRLLARWFALYREEIFAWHGAAPALAAATLGLGLALLAGALHALGVVSSGGTGHAFVLAFLLPLVTGAVSQLLPVWLHPGAQTPWHEEMRLRLGRWGGARALLFLGGALLAAADVTFGLALAGVALLLFMAQLLAALTIFARFRVE
jgi:hypothetical protein